MNYGYDASGNRITKKARATKEDYYVRDAQGNVLALYAYNNSSFTWAEQHLYGSNRVGMVTPGLAIQSTTPLANANYNTTGDPVTNGTEGKRMYELSNHLGNVMATISDRKIGIDGDNNGTIDYYTAEVLTAQDYYAFGSFMPGRTYSNVGAKYKYGFNGKENDNEVKGEGNSLDFGARIYDSRVGRWLSLDPQSQKYANESNYSFVSNSPVFVDPDGEDRITYTRTIAKDGTVMLSIQKTKGLFKAIYNNTYSGLGYFTKNDYAVYTTIDYRSGNREVKTTENILHSTGENIGILEFTKIKATGRDGEVKSFLPQFFVFGSGKEDPGWGGEADPNRPIIPY